MKLVKAAYAKEVSKSTQAEYAEMVTLIEKTQDLISKIEGKKGEPVVSITTKSKNFTLTITHG